MKRETRHCFMKGCVCGLALMVGLCGLPGDAIAAENPVTTSDTVEQEQAMKIAIILDDHVFPDKVELTGENVEPTRLLGRTAWYAYPGTKVTLTAHPGAGEKFVRWDITTVNTETQQKEAVPVEENTFIVPKNGAMLNVIFEGNGGNKPVPPSGFSDVSEKDYFYKSVQWAVDKGITKGTTPNTFSPNQRCTRAQAVTFLWNEAGRPEPASLQTDFIDVPKNSYYSKAVCWAKEQGITSGQSATRFGSDNICSRAEIITFQWRANGAPKVEASNNFVDVDQNAFYSDAVNWAVKHLITTGTSPNTFGPSVDCTRAQIVTFMFNEAVNQ